MIREKLKYLLEVSSFDSAFSGDMNLVLVAGPLVDDSQGAVEVRRRGLSREAAREEVIDGFLVAGGEEVSRERRQTATGKHRR